MKGASLFSSLTGNNKPLKDGFQRRLAILLDEKVHSAPSIRTTIGAHGIIEGIGTMQEVNELVEVLNAGALEVPLKKNPISEFTVSPTLGIDVQQRGITALIAATLAVFVFMAIYYLAIGLIADFCLMLNLILLVGIMSLIDATFTLPGLAGVVLTMGMAVDANVLIYERMREELSRGSSQRMAIHNGYDKAFSSIFDSNITTLLTAVILYMIGSDQVKGFAVTLFIGIGLSMYTALFVSRVLLEIVERKRWLKEFKMMTAIGETHMDFVKTQVPCAIASLVLIGAGLAAFFVRGDSNYDIDFTGGTMVSMVFKDEQNSDDVRNKLTEAFQSDITLEQLTVAGGVDKGRRFRVRTTEQDEGKVRKVINDAFPDQIERVTMTYGEPQAVAATTAATPPATTPEEKPAEKPAEPAAAGQQVELTFSRPVPPETMRGNFMEALATLKGSDGSPKYGELETTKSLFTLEPKVAVAEGAVDRADQMVLRTTDKVLAEADLKAALAVMQTTMANSPNFEEVNNFASSVAKEAKESAVIAIIASMIMIVAYIWFRFQNLWFGLAAVVALIHDVLAVLGLLAIGAYLNKTPLGPLLLLSDFKINLTMIAAFLTIVGYSLNDTIIIFDRLREIRGKNPAFTREMLNLAVNQTLSRTLLTAGTTFIVVFILYVLGGEGIHGFAYAMLLGVIVGTYSTIYVASPFVLYLMNRPKKVPGRPALAVSATRN